VRRKMDLASCRKGYVVKEALYCYAEHSQGHRGKKEPSLRISQSIAVTVNVTNRRAEQRSHARRRRERERGG